MALDVASVAVAITREGGGSSKNWEGENSNSRGTHDDRADLIVNPTGNPRLVSCTPSYISDAFVQKTNAMLGRAQDTIQPLSKHQPTSACFTPVMPNELFFFWCNL
ncbi:hypothetical protein D9613_000971 [Agrocybe pediades]|uniref:Uncharacterized protein n=1 Tax=Agrocybe pediades TaxID=84607 RepID=A0A8H4VV12_9AGAR|nr:hypothetical protein D9613_000971 [Agrocybe pediades]